VAPLRGGLDKPWSSAKQNNAFCFFFWKKKKVIRYFFLATVDLAKTIFSGASPRPRGSASRRVRQAMVFREAEQRFLLLFLEKEESDALISSLH
jgi:hypothetical protein